jgi:capsid protein
VTPSQLVEEKGYDYLEFLEQYAQDLQSQAAALGDGFMFDADPRKAVKSGAPQYGAEQSQANEADETAAAAA